MLVTPGISKGEQGVVDAALDDRLPLILLQKEQITDYWKPSKERFYACATGKLLILSPKLMPGDSDYEHKKIPISRRGSLNHFCYEKK
ncbi:hypothetical protein [uncultured Prevotella sp.]|uniref:hypothetical protein n=1 Tax=uncultured Prevotella sp. TaxID=159272 RepID=UPI002589539B|nr:hypothetical protein [uncultured Prevotella sp.]